MTGHSPERRAQLFRWIGHALLVGGFLLMMLDIRFEHRQIVGEVKVSWIPIIYSMAMVLLIPLAVLLWRKGGKHLLTVLYAGAIVVGMLGIYFHSDGHLFDRLQEVFGAWRSMTAADIPFFPPILAPFSFLGLGSIGLFLRFSEARFVKE